MKLSNFGEKFTGQTGIQSLMSDLGNALASDHPMIMMGGGNPAHIPQVEDTFKARLRRILDNNQEFIRLIGTYDPPQGEKEFISALVNLLNNQFGWGLTTHNVALTNGSQSAFFMLFNMFAGQYKDGSQKQILFPLAPEYIGYADAGLSDNFFTANRPSIELIDDHTFKYHVDFSNLKVTDNTGAICVSRPTNPTGNVLTDQEIEHLDKLAKQHDIPLFIDGAYGTPFPNLIFTEATPYWNDNIILCLSLSKLGLPACRTGIVIANEAVIESVTKVNAILSLATNSAGSLLAMDMVKDSSILTMSNEVIKPFYQTKVEKAVNTIHQALDGYDYYIHKPEGAMFLWLWFNDLPITSLELYERLKDKGVIVVSGHYFFPGINDKDWRHQQECIRITYSQDDEKVEKGLKIIAEEVKKAYQEG